MPPNFAEMRHVLNIAQACPPMLHWHCLRQVSASFVMPSPMHNPFVWAWSCNNMQNSGWAHLICCRVQQIQRGMQHSMPMSDTSCHAGALVSQEAEAGDL